MELSAERKGKLEEKLLEFERLRLDEYTRFRAFKRKTRFFKPVYYLTGISILPTVILPFLIAVSGPLILVSIGLYIYQSYLFRKVYNSPGEEYVHRFKTEILTEAFNIISPELSFHPYEGFSKSRIEAMNLFSDGITSYYAEDLCKGKIKDIDISFCEVTLYTKKRTRKSVAKGCFYSLLMLFRLGELDFESKEELLFFNGLLLEIDFHKSFEGEVFALPKAKHHDLLKRRTFNRAGLASTGLSDFDDLYDIYTNDDLLMHYVLTPGLAERITNLRENLGGEIYLSLMDGKFNLGIHWNRNLFEVSLEKGIPTLSDFIALGKEIELFEEILILLAQDRRIWGDKALV